MWRRSPAQSGVEEREGDLQGAAKATGLELTVESVPSQEARGAMVGGGRVGWKPGHDLRVKAKTIAPLENLRSAFLCGFLWVVPCTLGASSPFCQSAQSHSDLR